MRKKMRFLSILMIVVILMTSGNVMKIFSFDCVLANEMTDDTGLPADEEKNVYGAANAVDGDGDTCWMSEKGPEIIGSDTVEYDQNLIIDLGEEKMVDTVRINWGEEYASGYQIQVSADNISWQTVAEEYSGEGGIDELTFSPIVARYVKLYAFHRGTSKGYAVKEIELYGDNYAEENFAYQRRCAGSSESGMDMAANAVDGDGHTQWTSSDSSDAWYILDLGSVRRTDRIKIQWGDDYAKAYQIQYSSSNVDDYTQIPASDWVNQVLDLYNQFGGTVCHDFEEGIMARYIKVYMHQKADDRNYYALKEIEAYAKENIAFGKGVSAATERVEQENQKEETNLVYYAQKGVEKVFPVAEKLAGNNPDTVIQIVHQDGTVYTEEEVEAEGIVVDNSPVDDSQNRIPAVLRYTGKSTGVHEFYLAARDMAQGGKMLTSSPVKVKVYVYAVQDDVYVLDYGLDVELTDNAHGYGILQNDVLKIDTDAETIAVFDGVRRYDEEATVQTGAFADSGSIAGADGELLLDGFAVGEETLITGSAWSGGGPADYTSSAVLVYSPKRMMDSVELFQYRVTVKGREEQSDSVQMTGNITVLPASVVYYEDNFMGGLTVKDEQGIAIENERTISVKQSNSQDEVYGYDEAYAEGMMYGCNSALQMKDGYTAEFTFHGTGFEIIGTTGSDKMMMYVTVKNSAGKIVQKGYLDTYYNHSEEGGLYQVPVIRWMAGEDEDTKDRPADTYSVTLISYSYEYDAVSSSYKGSFWLDGIRIYHPLSGIYDPWGNLGEDSYREEEKNVQISRIKTLILGSQIMLAYWDGSKLNYSGGFTQVENIADRAKTMMEVSRTELEEYLSRGPNNEVYLESSGEGGSAIAFVVSPLEGTKESERTIQIEAKAINAFSKKDSQTGIYAASPVAAYASSTEGSGYEAENAIDNDASTRWASDPAEDASWLIVDLGEIKTLDHIELMWEAAYAGGYQIEITTEESWQAADASGTWNKGVYDQWNGQGGNEVISLTGMEARFIKLYASVKSPVAEKGWGYSLYEIKVYEQKKQPDDAVQAAFVPVYRNSQGQYVRGERKVVNTASSMYYRIEPEQCTLLSDGSYLVVLASDGGIRSISFTNLKTGGYAVSAPETDEAADVLVGALTVRETDMEEGNSYNEDLRIVKAAFSSDKAYVHLPVFLNVTVSGGAESIVIYDKTVGQYITPATCLLGSGFFVISFYPQKVFEGMTHEYVIYALDSEGRRSINEASGTITYQWMENNTSDPDGAVKETKQRILNYFGEISGEKTVIAMHNREPNAEPDRQTERVYRVTGKYPAMWSGDFLYQQEDVSNRQTMIDECIKQWNEGSIVQLMLHVAPPTVSVSQEKNGVEWSGTNTALQSALSDEQWTDLITDGGMLNTQWKKRLDEYAAYLQQLEDAGVVILFRPFHEMNQYVFWWAGRPGEDGTGALYRLTRDYLENEKGLSNLIWVWDMQDLWSGYTDKYDANDWSIFNPGEDYWDIFALDVYDTGQGYSSANYEQAMRIAKDKPMAIGECYVLPEVMELEAQPKWVFCMSWADGTFDYNSDEAIRNLYQADNVITRDELPELK